MTFGVKEFDLDDPMFAGNYNELNHAVFVFFSAILDKQYGLKLVTRRFHCPLIWLSASR